MNNIIGKWVGNTYGTHPSNVFAEISIHDNDELSLDLRYGPSNSQKVNKFIGHIDKNDKPNVFILTEYLNDQATGTTGKLIFENITDKTISGSWELNTGAKGIIRLDKSNMPNVIGSNLTSPPQIIAKQYTIDSPLTIHKKDIKSIIKIMTEIATQHGTVTITESIDEISITKFSQDYLKEESHYPNIKNLSFTAQFVENGASNILTLNLNRDGNSNIIAQSANLLWPEAASNIIRNFLKKRTNKLLGFYKKYGLEINFIFFLILLVILPSFNLKTRFIVIAGFLIFSFSHRFAYKKLSESVINAESDKPSSITEKYPKLSYLLSIIISLAIAMASPVLTNKVLTFLHFTLNWLTHIVGN